MSCQSPFFTSRNSFPISHLEENAETLYGLQLCCLKVLDPPCSFFVAHTHSPHQLALLLFVHCCLFFWLDSHPADAGMPIVALLIVSIVLTAMATTRASVHLSHSFQPILMAPFQPRVNKTVKFLWPSLCNQ